MLMFGEVVLQIPPATVLVSVTDAPEQTVAGPPIAEGTALTVTMAVVLQPPAVYTMASVPGATPVTAPPLTVATTPLLLHTPPAVAELNVVVAPAHTLIAPVIAAGDAFTVIAFVTVQPVPNE